ncbi:MAG: hydroxymethylbilane synthase, partial [Solirubrobacteraceae bacterium]|nr:hydroxymethylbilane synthase [Solirubrobacteraceae bacterium]
MRLGTRGSALALAQARQVAEALGGAELVTITTSGDRDRAALDKERWVREIDAALLRGDVDLAVHSAKDVPARLADGIAIAAVPPRADPRDALCGAPSLAALPGGARVGTS